MSDLSYLLYTISYRKRLVYYISFLINYLVKPEILYKIVKQGFFVLLFLKNSDIIELSICKAVFVFLV